MAYEYEIKIPMWLEDGRWLNMNVDDEVLDEIQEVYRKAKILDEVKGFIIRKLKEEEKEKPRTLLSDYDFGLYQAYDNVDDIIQEYLEREDDER
ncbi:hypothetical protein QI049_11190 [Staphylococcus saprophyticus]|nr:hypothetical protein [Staphylococcus saprophyticus]